MRVVLTSLALVLMPLAVAGQFVSISPLAAPALQQPGLNGDRLPAALPITDGGDEACDIERIIPRTSQRLQEFVQNVNRISATEVLEHERIGRDGKRREHERRKYNYVAIIEELRPGKMTLDEYRNGIAGNSVFPSEVATLGTTALALIFHPYHRDEFEMTCDNLSTWHEHRVWQVHFHQRKDKPARMSVFHTGGKSYPVLLMGTAWIDSENFQIMHLETDLMLPIPEVKLLVEHQSLDYGPVYFPGRDVNLWLPQQADIRLDSDGKIFHHLHTFSNYQIFSVDYGEKILAPLPPPTP